MNPADELRTAATKLRAHATAAADNSGSPHWHATRHFPDRPGSDFTSLWTDSNTILMKGGGGKGRPPAYVHAPVGDYIALMDPAIGLALADWLDLAASEYNPDADVQETDRSHEHALAVARAINGGEQQ
jgi:hypothetical protein